ncbi:autophagy-related protein 27 [Chlamydoabsidia padenii]|nr:autophagy-related protein 27 [Chlamydoabsidia padenii]
MMHLGFKLTVLCFGAFALSTVNGRQPYCNPGFKPKADTPFELDLSKLDKDFIIEVTTDTHPAKKKVLTLINICSVLTPNGNDKDEDKCNKQDYICRRKIFTKGGEDYVAVVQDIAGELSANFKPEFKLVGSSDDLTRVGTQYSLTLNGGTDLGHEQSASITLECDQQDKNASPSEPVPVSYQNNVLTVTWKTIHACAYKTGEKRPEGGRNDGNTETSSGAWTFFKILLIMGVIYLIGGALYNFNQYNARGLDLIPHRDFWLDLPYVIRDLVSHCVGSVINRRRGGGDQGYVAV